MDDIGNVVFCQSCGMPMAEDAQWGTEADGSTSADYCHYCYKDGTFASPDESMEEMIETCIPFMVEATEKDAEACRAMMQAWFPTLKRWKQ